MSKKKGRKLYPNEELIRNVLQDDASGIDKKQIANKYGINLGTVYSICAKNKAYETFKEQHLEKAEEQPNKVTEKKIEIVNSAPEEVETVVTEEVVETVEEVKEEQKPKRKAKTHITPDMKIGVICDYFGGSKLRQNELAELYDISASSVSKIIGSFQNYVKEKKTPKGFITFDESKLLSLTSAGTVKLGLVADRHDMPVKDFVYEDIDQDLMFDYDRLDAIAEKAIKEKIGNSGKSLILYATGLQSALTATIKVCDALDVPLTVMHYNAKDKTYVAQEYSKKQSTIIVPSEFDSLCGRCNEVFCYNCTPQELVVKKENILEVTECLYDQPYGIQGRNVLETKVVLFSNADEAWCYFRIKAEEAKENTGIYLNYGFISSNNKYCKDTSIAKVTN